MRGFWFMIFALLALAGVVWFARPAAVGDPGGIIAYVDRTAPQLAAWRIDYLHLPPVSGAPATVAAASTATAAAPAKPKAPPAVVVTAKAETKRLDLTFEALGTVQPMASVTLKPRLDGQITQLAVAEGAAVRQGDLIFKFDDKAQTSQLAQADAQIAKDKALLEQNKHDLARDDDLLKQKFIAPQVRETHLTTLNQTTAQIAVDNGIRNGILTQLTYLEIRSPLTGRIGSIGTKAGASVKSGDTLAVINQIEPIYVSFAVPQDRIGDLRAAMAAGKASVRLRDDAKAPTGKIAFMENAVDSSTGTIQVKAAMPNPAEQLWPGAAANIVLVTGTEDNALTVPSSAVQVGQKGTFVFVAKDGKAKIKQVTVERVAGPLTVIASGLSPDEDVVVSGQLALTDGAEIAPAKPAEANAKPASQG